MRKSTVLLVLLGLADLAVAGGVELTSARLYVKQKEWLKALEFYNAAIEKDPADPEAYFERGELLGGIAADTALSSVAAEIVRVQRDPRRELYQRMLADFGEAQTSRQPSDEKVIKKLRKKIDDIRTERWNEFYFEAVREDSAYEKAREEGVPSPDPKEHLRQAIDHLDMAIMMMPERWNSYGLKAQLLGRLQEREAATEMWEEALRHIDASDAAKKDPDTYKQAVIVIRANLLENYYNLERFREAVKAADEILQKDPASVDAIQFKAFSMARMAGDTSLTDAERNAMKSEAIKALNDARKARPDDPVILYYIGQFHLQLGDTAQAVTAFTDYLKVDEKDKDVLFALGVIYLEGGSFVDTKKAKTVYAKLVELYPEDGPAWINYGIALIRLGENEQGRKAVEKGKELTGQKRK